MPKFSRVFAASAYVALLASPAVAQYQGGYNPPQNQYQGQTQYQSQNQGYGQAQPQSYGQQAPASGGPLASIFSCQAGGNRQSTGAIIGALAGGVIGNKVADDKKTLGTAIGAALGAAAGSYVGCRMQVADQQRAQANAQLALDQGRSQVWQDPQTGAVGRTDIVNTYYQRAPEPPRLTVETVAYPQGMERPREYVPSEGVYRASSTTYLRSGPSQRAAVVGTLRSGDQVDSLVRVEGSPWLLAVRGGAAAGYVSETNLTFTGQGSLAGGGRQPQGPMCRTFDQTYQPRGAQADTQRYNACRSPQGDWVVQG